MQIGDNVRFCARLKQRDDIIFDSFRGVNPQGLYRTGYRKRLIIQIEMKSAVSKNQELNSILTPISPAITPSLPESRPVISTAISVNCRFPIPAEEYLNRLHFYHIEAVIYSKMLEVTCPIAQGALVLRSSCNFNVGRHKAYKEYLERFSPSVSLY